MAGFVFKNPGTCFFLAVGILMNIGSRLNDAYTFFNAGLPHQVYEAFGALIFFVTIIVLLYRWDTPTQLTRSGRK
jgi:prolipoprotein diacylglyceryltransferase